jgi:hypothetical protein
MLRMNLDNCSPTHSLSLPLSLSLSLSLSLALPAAVTKGTGELFSAIGEAGKPILSLPAAVARLNDEVHTRPI